MKDFMDLRVGKVFTRALEVPTAARQAFLINACGPDETLMRRVQEMLADARKADEFFGVSSKKAVDSPFRRK